MKCRKVIVSLLLLMSTLSAAFGETTWTLSFPSESATKQEGVAVVKRYMDLLVQERNEKINTQGERFKLVSKEWLESRGIDSSQYELNDYAFEEYRLLGIKNNYVIVKGTNPNGWARVIKFRLIVENGHFVIEPSKTSTVKGLEGFTDDTDFVTAWWTSSGLLRTTIDSSYKKADKEIVKKAAKLLERVLDSEYKGDERIFGEVVACGPFIWKTLAKEDIFAKADGAKLPVIAPSGAKMEGKVLRSEEAILALESYLRELFKKDGGFIVRKLTPEELTLYSVMIPFGMEEPIFILESKTHKILVDFSEDKVFYIEDFKGASSSVMY